MEFGGGLRYEGCVVYVVRVGGRVLGGWVGSRMVGGVELSCVMVGR